MHFYRALGLIRALTFDLDDTLYDNRPIMERTEVEVLNFMKRQFPQVSALDRQRFNQIRFQLLAQEPDIYHDVSEWRRRAFETTLRQYGLTPADALSGAALTMEQFCFWRSNIEVPSATHCTLRQLAARYPLVAITNGNADPQLFGLGDYFQLVLRAGPGGRAKPFGDMYLSAAQQLKLAPQTLLHVGDNLITDVAGAVRHGLQACWINDQHRNLQHEPTTRLLPHLEISRLDLLCELV